MLRYILWFVIAFMALKIARLYLNWKQNSGREEEENGRAEPPIPPFSNVQDAEFEDITPVDPPETPKG